MINMYGNTELTAREKQIAELVSSGLRNVDIGKIIGRSELGTKNCLRVIYDKTGMSNRTELALWWVARKK